jgi:SAM-dependent methyltransferase
VGSVRDAAWYDQRFADPSSKYLWPAEKLPYFDLWKFCVSYMQDGDVVVDLGCGPGHLAQMATKARKIRYRGYDFSEQALRMARARAPEGSFFHWDATRDAVPRPPSRSRTVYVATEFLEHIEDDLKIVGQISAGDLVLLTVPSRDDPGHVRFFKTVDDVRKRYASHLDIIELKRYEAAAWRKGAVWYFLAGNRKK